MADPIPNHLSLAPLCAAPERKPQPTPRNSAFAAQLLAAKLDAPVARRLRREAPGEAMARYRSCRMAPTRAGRWASVFA